MTLHPTQASVIIQPLDKQLLTEHHRSGAEDVHFSPIICPPICGGCLPAPSLLAGSILAPVHIYPGPSWLSSPMAALPFPLEEKSFLHLLWLPGLPYPPVPEDHILATLLFPPNSLTRVVHASVICPITPHSIHVIRLLLPPLTPSCPSQGLQGPRIYKLEIHLLYDRWHLTPSCCRILSSQPQVPNLLFRMCSVASRRNLRQEPVSTIEIHGRALIRVVLSRWAY